MIIVLCSLIDIIGISQYVGHIISLSGPVTSYLFLGILDTVLNGKTNIVEPETLGICYDNDDDQ